MAQPNDLMTEGEKDTPSPKPIEKPVKIPEPAIDDPLKEIGIPIEEIGTFTRIKFPPAQV